MSQLKEAPQVVEPFPLSTLRHSVSHLMASAVAKLFPGVQFGFGQVKLARNSALLVPVAVCWGTMSLPFFDGVNRAEVVVVSNSEKGSTILLFTPGLWHTPLKVVVTASVTVAFV